MASDQPTVIGSNPLRDRFGYWMERVAAGEQVIVTRRGKARIRLVPASAPQSQLPRSRPPQTQLPPTENLPQPP
jgi:prevent-host-death family protein